MSGSIAMDSPLAGSARPEKALWYREVLSLDPDSRIFLPYARLLFELGQTAEAADVLKAGLTRHPEFLEARLFLIELLHAQGQDAAAGFEADSIIELLSQSPALWHIWSRRPGLRTDQAAMLLFFASSMRQNGHSLADVFEAGIAALAGTKPVPAAPSPSGEELPEEPLPPADEAPAAPAVPAEAAASASPREPAFVMQEETHWYALDSVPEDDDIYDDEEPESPPLSAMLFVQAAADAQKPEPGLPAQTEVEHIPAMNLVPRAPLEGKSSLCTRSMARVLEEQGATDEAAEIYRELLSSCSSQEEEAELNAKLASLLQNAENAAPVQPSSSGVLDMLESLAARLENRNRA